MGISPTVGALSEWLSRKLTGNFPDFERVIPRDNPIALAFERRVVEARELDALFGALRERGHTLLGPTVRDGAIVLATALAAACGDTGPSELQARPPWSRQALT